jgi:prevent-host-death family protein
MSQVTISALKSHLSEHLRRAEAGEVIEVLDRARPIAKVVPIDRADEGLETVPPVRSFASVRAIRLPPLGPQVDSLDALRQERGSR